MRDLVDTTEMYLRTVYELEEEGITPLRARIAERLEQSGPTVSQTVARMERDGLIVVEHDRSLSLTEEGRRRATDLRLREPARAKVIQVSEILQDGALPKNAGQLVGAVVTLTPLDDGALEVATQDGNNFHLTADVAHALRVEPEN